MTKNILILTSDAGFGHRRAAEAVEGALKNTYPDDCAVKIMNPLHDPSLPDLVKSIETGYDDMVVDDPTFYQIAYSATDAPVVAQLMQRITTRVLNDTLSEWMAVYRPDVVLTTYPAFTQAAIRAAETADHIVPVDVVVTDLIGVHSLWLHQGATTTFVPTGNVYRQALDAGMDKTRVQLTGLPVNPAIARDTRTRKELRQKLGWTEDQTTCIVVGSARTRKTAGIAQLLDRSGLDLQVVAVSGGDERIDENLRAIEWRGRVHTYGFVDNMPEMLKAADFIICKAGGLIVSESLACGLPLILYEALPGQEVGNVKYVTEAGAGDWSPGPIGALTTCYSWFAREGEIFKGRRAAARKIGKPRAAYDIAEWVMRQADDSAAAE